MVAHKSIYDMGLHEVICMGENSDTFAVTIQRVSGGWIYTTFDKSHSIISSVFVPFDNEFMNN